MAADSGVGTYLSNLLPRLVERRPEWRFTVLGRRAHLEALPWPGTAAATVAIRDCTAPIYSASEQVELVAKCPRPVDLFWSPHYNIPLAYTGRLMVTVHDVAHLAMPEFAAGVAKQLYARAMYGAVRRRARAIVFDSVFSRSEFLRLVGGSRGAIEVVHLGIDPIWRRQPAPDRPRARAYIVYVGNVKPQKNLGVLLRAFASIKDSIPHDLVIIGRKDGMRTADQALAVEARALGDRVELTGEIPFDRLRALVSNADALVAPSLYEGFGLPPLEAMAAGCPCLVSRVASHPEVCGDAASYCNPHDAADVAQALQRLLTDAGLRATLRERGTRRAAQFTWERCADATIGVMERTIGGS
jgi:glycosyltransferase involved in cell wall biosynthesis